MRAPEHFGNTDRRNGNSAVSPITSPCDVYDDLENGKPKDQVKAKIEAEALAEGPSLNPMNAMSTFPARVKERVLRHQAEDSGGTFKKVRTPQARMVKL